MGAYTAAHTRFWTRTDEVPGELSFSCRFSFAPLDLGVLKVVVNRATLSFRQKMTAMTARLLCKSLINGSQWQTTTV
jgi:hypothetical protein